MQVIANDYNAGFSVANNIAIRRSSSPFVLLLNSDAFLRPGCLSKLLSTIRGDASIGAVGPKLFLKSGDVQNSVTRITSPVSQFGYLLAFHFPPFDVWIRPIFNRSRHLLVSGNEQRDVQLLSAACLLLRRTVFETVGLLPEDRFLYSEEDDLFFRMRMNKFRSIFQPAAEADHLQGESMNNAEKKTGVSEHFVRSRLRFLFMHYPQSRFFTFAMHWGFFTWCRLVAQLKYLIRGSDADQFYLADSLLLIDITRKEYARLREADMGNSF